MREFNSVILVAVGDRRQMDGDASSPTIFYDDAAQKLNQQTHAALAQTEQTRRQGTKLRKND
jgi:hypothetical protein